MSHETTPKKWQAKGWSDVGSDCNWEDYGGLWGKRAGDGVWFFVRFDNMLEHMGAEEMQASGTEPLCAQVKQVDLNEVPLKELKSAMESCGPDDIEAIDEEYHELIHAEACQSYGCSAPLDEFFGTNPVHVRAEAFRAAEYYMQDDLALEDALDKPVNKLGSTARDFRGGNCLAGLERYAAQVQATGAADDATKNLMLKLHGVDAQKLADTPPQPVVKTVKQRDLTGECWMVQMHGTEYCTTCEVRGKPDCGGKDILRKGVNEKGIEVDAHGMVEPDPTKPRGV